VLAKCKQGEGMKRPAMATGQRHHPQVGYCERAIVSYRWGNNELVVQVVQVVQPRYLQGFVEWVGIEFWRPKPSGSSNRAMRVAHA
jgi:hypothetical protein